MDDNFKKNYNNLPPTMKANIARERRKWELRHQEICIRLGKPYQSSGIKRLIADLLSEGDDIT